MGQLWPRTTVSYGFTGTIMFATGDHDDVIKWKHFPRYWPFVRGIRRSPVNSPHTGWWRRALMFSLICASINGWVKIGEAGELRCHRAHYDITHCNVPDVVMTLPSLGGPDVIMTTTYGTTSDNEDWTTTAFLLPCLQEHNRLSHPLDLIIPGV